MMEPYLFPECLICQVHAFGFPLRRESLFCVCLAIPETAAVPGSRAHYHTAVPQDVVRQTQELQRERGTPSPLADSACRQQMGCGD